MNRDLRVLREKSSCSLWLDFSAASLDADDVPKKYPITNTSVLAGLNNQVDLFEDAIKALESEFPAQTKLEIPRDPVVCITPLFGDENHEPVPR